MNRESALRVMVMEVMSMVTTHLHLYSTSGATYVLPLSPCTSFLMPNMWHFRW